MVYRRRIQYPDIIGVQLGSPDRPSVVPAELCIVPAGQVFRQKLPEHVMDQVRKFSTKKPFERIEIIKNGVSRAGQRVIEPPVLHAPPLIISKADWIVYRRWFINLLTF